MEITINPVPFVEAEIDIPKFKDKLKESLDINKAIICSTQINFNKKLTEEEIKEAIYYCLDWGKVIDYLKDINKDKMIIRFCDCLVKGRIEYSPDYRNKEGTYFKLHKEEYDSHEHMLIQSFINIPDANLDNFIKQGVYDYSKRRWKLIKTM